MYNRFFKRLFDIMGAIILLPIVLIVIIVFGPLIYIEDRGSIFYMAKRRGINGKKIEMFKLRSMYVNAPDIRNEDNSTFNSPDDPRITKIGKFIRKFSLDELPQVFNILFGDMSFIGPRPVTIDKPLNEYDEKRRCRLTVKPGITGYSQAYYRNTISQEDKFELDAKYAKNITFIFDIKIFIKTLQMVLMRRGIYNTKNSNGRR